MILSQTDSSFVRACRQRRHGFTLAEMIVGMVVTSASCAAVLSLTVLLARATEGGGGTSMVSGTVATRRALDQVLGDVRQATHISERTPSAITMIVPDRTGDAQPETIRYSWAGPGQPLLRRMNGGTTATVLLSANSFALTFADRTITPSPPQESGEMVLHSFDEASATTKYAIKDKEWAAQVIMPTLPDNAISWSITKVRLCAVRSNTGIPLSVEVRTVDGAKKPQSGALSSVTTSSSAFGDPATWVTITFHTPLRGLSPGTAYAIVVRGLSSSSTSVEVMFDDSTYSDISRRYTSTKDRDSGWMNPSGTRAIKMYVYGTVTVQP